MTPHERRGLDRSVTHSYIEYRENTIERLSEEGSRIIIETITEDDSVYDKLLVAKFPLFPSEKVGQKRIHYLPSDSRDLTDFIRLSRDTSRVTTLGTILGIRLGQIHNITHSLPSDTILPRFAVHSKPTNSIDHSGVDVKPLPPFDRYSNDVKLSDITNIVFSDLLEIGEYIEPKLDDFIEGVEHGLNSVV